VALLEQLPLNAGNWAHLNDLLAVSHNPDGTLKGGIATSPPPWTTTLNAPLSGGETSITVKDQWPIPDFAANGNVFYVCIGAWTTNAEVRQVTVKAGATWTVADALVNPHTAGESIVLVQDRIYASWFGVRHGFLTSTAGQAAAANNALAATAYIKNGYGATIVFGPYIWQMDGTLTVPGTAGIDLDGGNLVWPADLGAGQYAITLPNVGAIGRVGPVLKGGGVIGAFAYLKGKGGTDMVVTNGSTTVTSATGGFTSYYGFSRLITIAGVNYTTASVTNSTTLVLTAPYAGTSGSGKTWALSGDQGGMDGIQMQANSYLQSVVISNFRSGIRCFGFDHGTFDHLYINNCWYGISIDSSASNGGDCVFDRVTFTGMGRACVETSNSSLSASSWKDCHFFGSPVGFWVTAATLGNPLVFYRTSFEQLGNAVVYNSAGASGTTFGFVSADTSTGLTGNSITLASPAADGGIGVGVFYSDPAVASNWEFHGYLPWVSSVSPAFVGKWTPSSNGSGMNLHNQTITASPLFGASAVGDASDHVYWDNIVVVGGGTVAMLSTVAAGTVSKGDLLEKSGNLLRQYQTAGAAPWAIALENDNGTAKVLYMCAIQGNVVQINVQPGNTVAAGAYLKPDGVNHGRVVAATGFSDGPIVGIAYEANNASTVGYGSANTVKARLLF
jgi:hypothetical protein